MDIYFPSRSSSCITLPPSCPVYWPHFCLSTLILKNTGSCSEKKTWLQNPKSCFHSKDTTSILQYRFIAELTRRMACEAKSILLLSNENFYLLILSGLKPLDSKRSGNSHPTPSLVYFMISPQFVGFTTLLTFVLELLILENHPPTLFCKQS